VEFPVSVLDLFGDDDPEGAEEVKAPVQPVMGTETSKMTTSTEEPPTVVPPGFVLVGGKLVEALADHPYTCPLCGRHYRAWFITMPLNYNCWGGCARHR